MSHATENQLHTTVAKWQISSSDAHFQYLCSQIFLMVYIIWIGTLCLHYLKGITQMFLKPKVHAILYCGYFTYALG